jgi:microcystin degradation protein MlrC
VRFIVGGIMHETHTFSSERTTLASMSTVRGDELWRYAGTNHSLGGTLDGCRNMGIDVTPTLLADGISSGIPDRETFETLLDELTRRIAAGLPADGVVLNLHGAMVAEGFPDAEAEIARRVRAVVGERTPIAVTLDFHANIGQEMIDMIDILTTYDTYPHVDAADRAREAVALLHRTVLGEIRPTMTLVKPPLMPVPQAQFTSKPPFATLFARAFELEESGSALTITIAGGFAYADVPTAGMSIVVTTDNDPRLAEDLATELASLAWAMRDQMVVHNVPPAEAVARAIAAPEGQVMLVDVGDNIGGGTPGDGTVLLAELLRQRAQQAVIVIADREAVAACSKAGVGSDVELMVGGKTDRRHGDPCPIRGTVQALSDGHWVHEGPENAGVPVDMGPTVVLQVDGVLLVLTSTKCMPGDLQQLRSLGIEPVEQHIIVVKAAVRWRGGYGPIAKDAIHVDTPGLGSVDLSRFEFRSVRRPIFPLDHGDFWTSLD